MKQLIILLISIGSSLVSAKANEPIKITLEDISKGTSDYRTRITVPGHYLQSNGDFDGDGCIDQAAFYKYASKYALRVTLGSGMSIQLHEGPLGQINVLGVDTVQSGKYERACSKGYGDKCSSKKNEVTFEHAAIRFFTFESSSRAYHWIGHKFEAVYLTD